MDKLQIGIHYSIIYFLIVFLSVIFCAFTEMGRKQKKIYLFCVMSVFFIIMAFRSSHMGNDTQNYIAIFNKVSVATSPIGFAEATAIEKGYILYNSILSKIFGANARWLFVITAVLICHSLGRYIDKYSNTPGIVCCLFVPMSLSFFMAGLRQAIAVAIFLYSYDFIENKKFIKFLLLSILALQFHNSAIIFLALYFMMNYKSDASKWFNTFLMVVTVVCFCFFDKFLILILRIFPKYVYYVGGVMMDGEPRLAIFLQVIVSIMLLFVPKILEKHEIESVKKQSNNEKLSKINVALLIISSNATALNRMSAYFTIFALNQYSNDFSKLKSQNKTILLVLTVIAFYLYGLIIAIYKTPDWETTYPLLLQWEM